MDPSFAIILAIVALLLLLVLRVPVALALGISGALGITLIGGWSVMMASLGGTPFTATVGYSLVVVPMFILLGSFAVQARLAEQVFEVAQRHLGKIPGGLGLATVAACAGFSAVSGSSVATAATFGRLSIGEMRNHGYAPSFAAGIVASAGTLGAMIPPSILLVFYAILTGESVGMMLIAGIVPGILQALIYSLYVLFRAHKYTSKARATTVAGSGVGMTREKRPPYRGLVRLAMIFLIVMSGVYTGIFTISESASVGAVFTALILILERRGEGFREVARRLYIGLRDCASMSSMIFVILVGSGIFSYFLVLSGAPVRFASWAISLPIPPWLLVAMLLLFLIPLGMILDSFSILAITIPLVYPVVIELGYDGIWLGILFVIMCELGLMTPPVGINAYVVAGSATGVPIEQVFKGLYPFSLLCLLSAALIFVIPQITTWLPGLVMP